MPASLSSHAGVLRLWMLGCCSSCLSSVVEHHSSNNASKLQSTDLLVYTRLKSSAVFCLSVALRQRHRVTVIYLLNICESRADKRIETARRACTAHADACHYLSKLTRGLGLMSIGVITGKMYFKNEIQALQLLTVAS